MKPYFKIILSLMVVLFSVLAYCSLNPCIADPDFLGCLPQDNPNKAVNWSVLSSFPVEENPESVLASGDKIFVSNMGIKTGPIKNGDGNISLYDLTGKKDGKFKPTHSLNSPMGMTIIGSMILVVDIDRIVSLSKDTGNFLFEISLENEGVDFLNDIVKINQTTLVVSATNQEKLFLVDLSNKSYVAMDIEVPHPNGLAFDTISQTLFVAGNKEHALKDVGNGYLMGIQLDQLKVGKVIFRQFFGRFLDGIAKRGNTLLVSDWKSFESGSSIFTYRIYDNKILNEQELSILGVADFSTLPEKRKIALPNLIENRVFILGARAR